MQLVFGRNPEIPGDLLSDNPDLIANSSQLHDRGAGQAARVRTVARTKLMLHSDKLNARRALDTRPRVVPTFLPGDMVAVWRMMKGGGIPGKRAHHRWRPGLCMDAVRGNYWIALPGSVVKVSPEQLRPAAREERHAWRLVEAELRTKLVNFDEFSGHRSEDITGGERPPREEEDPVEKETVREPPFGHQETHPTGGRRITGKTTSAGADPHQVRDQDSQVPSGDSKRPRVENESALETRQTLPRTWIQK